MEGNVKKHLRFKGAEDFRTKLTLALLSGSEITIENIIPRIAEHEVAFLKLVTLLSDGSKASVSPDGSKIKFLPGMIRGGEIDLECPPTRSVGYYLEYLLFILPFANKQTIVTLRGVTNDNSCISADIFRDVTLRQFAYFMPTPESASEQFNLEIKSRGFQPLGGGCVVFTFKPLLNLAPVDFSKINLFGKIRGNAISGLIPPAIANRAITAAKGEALNVLSDVYITADHAKKNRAGNSPGYGINMIAETVTGCCVGAEMYVTKEMGDVSPEDVGKMVCRLLLKECELLGAPDSRHQTMILMCMALTPEDVSLCRIGKLTQRSIRTLRLIKEFLSVSFQLDPKIVRIRDPSTKVINQQEEKNINDSIEPDMINEMEFIFAMCRGCGIRNVNMKGF